MFKYQVIYLLSNPVFQMLEELVFVSRQIIQLFTTSPELTKTTHDFEALWVKMQNRSQSTMICSVIYLHPNGYIQNFMDNLNSTVDRIHRKDKFCITLGDFNLDLLKLDSHADTENFLNTLGVLQFSTTSLL